MHSLGDVTCHRLSSRCNVTPTRMRARVCVGSTHSYVYPREGEQPAQKCSNGQATCVLKCRCMYSAQRVYSKVRSKKAERKKARAKERADGEKERAKDQAWTGEKKTLVGTKKRRTYCSIAFLYDPTFTKQTSVQKCNHWPHNWWNS